MALTMRALTNTLSALRLTPSIVRPSLLLAPSIARPLPPTPIYRTISTTPPALGPKQRSGGGSKKGAAAARGRVGGRGAGGGRGARGKKGQPERLSENQLRVRTLREGLHSPAPPPLRMARNRWLRHWTIHRAWMAYQKKKRTEQELELLKLHQGMQDACEELRTTAGPGRMEEGYLFRRAMMHDGVFAPEGVPIEYARFQTESPGREPWNHGWKR